MLRKWINFFITLLIIVVVSQVSYQFFIGDVGSYASPESESQVTTVQLPTTSTNPSQDNIDFEQNHTSLVYRTEDLSFEQTLEDSISSVSTLDQQTHEWIHRLSREEGFEAWSEATWERYPLGPGQHGWVVILSLDKQEVGYMVVHSTIGDRWAITEYGHGPYPLFSVDTLHRSMYYAGLISDEQQPHGWHETELTENYGGQSFSLNGIKPSDSSQQEIINIERIYLNPFEAYWSISVHEQVYLFDASTGEDYSFFQAELQTLTNTDYVHGQDANLSPAEQTERLELLPSFDPFEKMTWVERSPLQIAQPDELLSLLKQQEQVTYLASLYNHYITIPLAINGYHMWDKGQLLLAVEQDSLRFIPYEHFQHFGEFYANPE